MSAWTLQIRFFSDYYLSRWCRNEGNCDPEEVKKHLMLWIARFAFFSWLPDLPEQKFGTIMSSSVDDYVGKRATEGSSTFIKSAFGEDWVEYFQNSNQVARKKRGSLSFSDEKPGVMRSQNQNIQQPHPLNLMQLFVPNPLPSPFINLTSMPRNVSKMVKFFLFSGYAEAISKQKNISVADIVRQELERFPYELKDTFIVRLKTFKKII